MSAFSEKAASAQSRLFSLHGEQATYNGSSVTIIPEDTTDSLEGMVASNALGARIRKSDVAQPYTEDKVIIDGYQYRVGEGFYLSGDDWVLTLTPDYIEF